MPFYIHKCRALIWTNKNGQLHREDGPAVIWLNGKKEYWLNGQLHREDGPACISPNGYKEYWLNYNLYSKKEYYKVLKELKQKGC